MSETRPRLGVAIRNFAATAPADWRHILDQARAAEDAGIDRLFVADHLVFGHDLSAYAEPGRGGISGGVQPTGPDGDWLEPLTVLAALAAVTNRVRLTTNVLVAPLRRAVVLAKVAATIDVLSHGRFDLGVGIGWQEAEYRAAGVSYAERGRALDETLAACYDLWTAREATFATSQYSLAGAHMMPKPTEPAGVPIWIGGRPIAATARRLARHGSGWFPWGVTRDSLPGDIARMRDLVTEHGADLATLKIGYGLPTVLTPDRRLDLDLMFSPVREVAQHGVTDFLTMIRVPGDYDGAFRSLRQVAERFAVASDQARR